MALRLFGFVLIRQEEYNRTVDVEVYERIRNKCHDLYRERAALLDTLKQRQKTIVEASAEFEQVLLVLNGTYQHVLRAKKNLSKAVKDDPKPT